MKTRTVTVDQLDANGSTILRRTYKPQPSELESILGMIIGAYAGRIMVTVDGTLTYVRGMPVESLDG